MARAKPKTQREFRKFWHISEDHPLTKKEAAFVLEYIKDKNGAEAAVRAGFSPKTAKHHSYDLIHHKPNTRKAIERKLNRYFERLDFDAYDILKRLGNIALGRSTELVRIENGRVVISDTSELSDVALDLFAGAEETINERGDVSVKVKQHGSVDALKVLCQYYGILDRARQAKQAPLDEQIEALRAVRNGEKTAVEAALDLEMQGVPLPDTLRIMLTKQAEAQESEDEGESIMPTPEEMEEKRRKRFAEIEQQRNEFLPTRQEEVRKIKEEMGERNQAFADGKAGDGKKEV